MSWKCLLLTLNLWCLEYDSVVFDAVFADLEHAAVKGCWHFHFYLLCVHCCTLKAWLQQFINLKISNFLQQNMLMSDIIIVVCMTLMAVCLTLPSGWVVLPSGRVTLWLSDRVCLAQSTSMPRLMTVYNFRNFQLLNVVAILQSPNWTTDEGH